MAIIKCPECGKEISDTCKKCIHCGYKVNANKINDICKEKRRKIHPKYILYLVGVIIIIIATGLIITKNQTLYATANYLYKQQKYDKAEKVYSYIKKYKDSEKLEKQAAHLYDVKTDKEKPVIHGIKEGEIVDIEFGEKFNLEDFLDEKTTFTDNVSKEIDEYLMETADNIFNSKTADVDTMQPGEYDSNISIEDEAGNKTVVNFVLNIKPLHISKENKYPVIYDGDYGVVSLDDVAHKTSDDSFILKLKINNTSDVPISAYLSSVYINDYQINAYTDAKIIDAGKKGNMNSYIYKKEIPEEVSDYSQIEGTIYIASQTMMGDMYAYIPVIIDKDVFQQE